MEHEQQHRVDVQEVRRNSSNAADEWSLNEGVTYLYDEDYSHIDGVTYMTGDGYSINDEVNYISGDDYSMESYVYPTQYGTQYDDGTVQGVTYLQDDNSMIEGGTYLSGPSVSHTNENDVYIEHPAEPTMSYIPTVEEIEPTLVNDEPYYQVNTDDVPTGEELATLRRVSDKIPIRAYTIAFVELVERMSYYGAVQVFVNFIQQPNPGTSTGRALHPGDPNALPGALNLGQRASTGLTQFNQFWVYLMPLFGAYLADTYLGRFKMIWISVLISIAGHIILTVSAIPSVMANTHTSLGVFIVGIIVMGIGTGGFKPNISPLVAEQIGNHKIRVQKLPSGERVIVDPAVTLSRVYNWFYLIINVGALVGQISMVFAERYVGYYLSFLVPTVTFCLALPVLFICRNWYEMRAPEGSVLGPALKLFFRGMKGRIHANPIATYKHMHDGTFWENLKPSMTHPALRPEWMGTFNDAWVDEVHRGFKACSVFIWFPVYWLTYNQLNNNLTSQAAVMALHGAPNDVIANLNPLALILLIPVCDLFFYPTLRRMGIRFSPIKRITAGFMLGSIAMAWAAVIQAKIYEDSACGNHAAGKQANGAPCPNVSISVWAQTGCYILIALSEIFASITSLEYAFSKAPKNMRSLVASFALFMTAISAAIGEAFTSLSSDPLLTWNYTSMSVISFVAGLGFWYTHRGLDQAEDKLNMLPEGQVGIALGDLEKKPSNETAAPVA